MSTSSRRGATVTVLLMLLIAGVLTAERARPTRPGNAVGRTLHAVVGAEGLQALRGVRPIAVAGVATSVGSHLAVPRPARRIDAGCLPPPRAPDA